MKFKRTVLAVSIAAAVATLSACGGGGGGSGGTQSYINNQVPFYTPVRVGSITPLTTTAQQYDSSAMFSASLSGSGQEVVIAGRATPNGSTYSSYNLSVFGWSSGTLVNRTSQWFSGTDNQILGTEPSVKFADFNGDGKLDMYVATNTDTGSVYGPSLVFFNNGSNFTRVNIDIGNTSGHDSAVYDLNGDGYLDIVTTGLHFSFGGANKTFTTYAVGGDYSGGGAGVAVADFMGNGTSSLVLTDVNGSNKLYSWSQDSNGVYIHLISTLPTPRFMLPAWAGYGFTKSHDIRALAFDFDSSGKTSVVIISRPEVITNGSSYFPQYSEVQFNKNMGGGVFVDVTSNVLVGYDTTATASYNPQLMDVNSDGLIDIVLSSPNWASNSGTQVLIHTKEHKYVASYATVIQAFQDQAMNLEKAINSSVINGANGIVFVQGPDGSMYLATAVTYYSSGAQQKAIYLSKLGAAVTSAQATADSIKQRWPWMSDAQVNTVLAQSSTTWFGLNVLNPDKALQPIGSLTIPGSGNGINLSGYVIGLNLKGAANSIKALDSTGRDFNINYSVTSFNMANMFSRFADKIKDDTRSAQLFGDEIYNLNSFKFGGTPDNKSFVIGYTGIPLSTNTQLNVQYSRLPFSPFVALNGAWGMVKSSDTFESTVSYRENGWAGKLGLMYTATEIYTGLVTRVNPITSMWAEAGYEWEKLRVYGGMLPKPIIGSANLTLPTGIDSQGRIMYTNSQAEISSPVVTYARISYTERINKNVTFKLNGMATTQNQQTIMGEVKFNF